MAANSFFEGVKPGGLTNSKEIRILLCYLMDCVAAPITREQLDNALLGEELVNYFAMAESLSQLLEQKLVELTDDGYRVTAGGQTVGRTLAQEVPLTVRDAAVRSVIRAQQYAAKAAAYQSRVEKRENGFQVNCDIQDDQGALFSMEVYMPDRLSADMVRDCFTKKGDMVYKLVLAALTQDNALARKTLEQLGVEV